MHVTANHEIPRVMIREFLVPQSKDNDVDGLCSQKEGAICYTAAETINLRKETFGERITSSRGPV